MPDLDDPGVQDAATAFGLACLFMLVVLGSLADRPMAAMQAGGILGLVAAFALILRASPAHPVVRHVLALTRSRRHQRATPRAAIESRARAHLWFAQWMAAFAAISFAAALVLRPAV